MSDLQDIRNRIKAAAEKAGRTDLPQLVAVSKMQPIEKIMLVYEEGHRIFGENYVQELVEKKSQMEAMGVLEIDFHFIGHLQTNKVKSLLPYVTTLHSVDSEKLLTEVANRASQLNRKIACYFQVNIDEEETKSGFKLGELAHIAKLVPRFDSIIPMGLMCIPDPHRNPGHAYSTMKDYSREYHSELGSGLSMGMSDDFELAISMGSTAVRVGSALFGPRSKIAQ